MTRIAIRLFAAVFVVTLLDACVVGPNFKTPDAPSDARYTAQPLPAGAGDEQRFVEALDIPGQWWTLYRSPRLQQLVEQALKANPDLAAAKAALRQARENTIATRGQMLPTADLNYSVTREKDSNVIAPVLASNVTDYSLHTAQLSVGYAPDVFGGLRRQTETAVAQEAQQRYQAEATYLTLTSNLVAAVILQASLAEQVAETRAIIDEDRKGLDLMRQQLKLGQAARPDVAAQETLLAQAEQTLPPLDKQLAQQADLIAALTGSTPSQAAALPVAMADLTLPAELPVSLPSKLTGQRPDIKQAEANLHAASAGVGVAIAARLPTFPLTANVGGESTSLGSLFSNGDDFWLVGASIAQPVFHGGQLLHRQRQAEAALDQAKAQYRSTVLTAFQNVADSLEAITADARALQAAAHTEQAAADSLASAQQQVSAGQASSLALLTAEGAHQQALLAVTQAKAARLSDTAALFQALGGGWWNRQDLAAR